MRIANLRLALAFSLFLGSIPAIAADVAEVCFTPGQDCTGLIVHEVEQAKREVLVQAYSFTSPQIAKALADARRRGVDVRVILDQSQTGQKKSQIAADTLVIAKVSVLDRRRVVTGSFNFTKAAQDRNAENVVILAGEDVAGRYVENWHRHAEHSERYDSR
jgi:phosphatidylserine/phosphatidylglycerophosphate/cardiolipin synthase-like enzyme